MIGAHDDVAVPPGCQVLDYELEVAAVVSRDGSSVAPAQARDYIFGYTIFNDWSARDLQAGEMRSASARPRARISLPRSARSSSRPMNSIPF
jgi:2-keto-4-pentenoate hydratase/2-oxohepta-3-ene-1,7-dioic acid hydratase in catechol pathway